MTRKQKIELAKYWQRALRLSDWHIEYCLDLQPHQMSIPNTVGCSTVDEVHKTAIVEILDEAAYPQDLVLPYSFTRTLIHELLHVKMCMLDDVSEMQSRILHQIIEDIAYAVSMTTGGEG